jgi:hypothetical protein
MLLVLHTDQQNINPAKTKTKVITQRWVWVYGVLRYFQQYFSYTVAGGQFY